ncbi:chemotaxis protein methyltransferase CheR [Roseateles sp. YR242]|uniref:CheR family methyltransferase n=1 Tax=Roseateles sp. YR242 TaxID=1855305 RepID=UPI0008C7F2FB|nr:protein-glutamate O-methyltransferase CheR [Roseateles sp. YR242]SEK94517.1 chemotaxis protein methyltransferase CheR [Roseateles sp. YR242]
MIRTVAPAPVTLEGENTLGLLERLRTLVAQRLGLLIDRTQDDRLRDGLRRLAAEEGPAAYVQRLEKHASQADLDALAAELTVGETYFFRHSEQFDALRTVVLPTWLRRHPAPRRLRVLCAGCASGEEPYTLAMTLQRSVLGAGGVDWDIVAFDVNAAAIRRATAARYNEWSLRATSATWRDLWFQRDETGWTPLPSLRRRVRFEQRQIATPDAAFWAPDSFDVIFCRNMLMYLDGPSLRRAVQHLATALAPGGALFLGHAETLHSLTDRLELRQAAGCFFYQPRVQADEASNWPFPTLMSSADAAPGAAPLPAAGQAPALASATSRHSSRAGADERHAPPSMLDEALLLVEAGQLDDGLRACARLMSTAPSADLQAEALFIQALALEERGELPAAEWHHQRAAAKDLAFAMPHLRLGLLARRRGEPVAARRELRRALELLDGESTDRLRRFGGGFERDALRQLCLADLGDSR